MSDVDWQQSHGWLMSARPVKWLYTPGSSGALSRGTGQGDCV